MISAHLGEDADAAWRVRGRRVQVAGTIMQGSWTLRTGDGTAVENTRPLGAYNRRVRAGSRFIGADMRTAFVRAAGYRVRVCDTMSKGAGTGAQGARTSEYDGRTAVHDARAGVHGPRTIQRGHLAAEEAARIIGS